MDEKVCKYYYVRDNDGWYVHGPDEFTLTAVTKGKPMQKLLAAAITEFMNGNSRAGELMLKDWQKSLEWIK